MRKILVALLAAGVVLSSGTDSMAKVDWAKASKQKPKQSQSSQILVGAALTNGGDSGLGIGARIEYPLDVLLPNLSITSSLNYFFPGSYNTWWEINANVLYSFHIDDVFTPYVGAGLNYASWKYDWIDPYRYYGYFSGYQAISVSNTMTSLNVIGGCKFNLNLGFTPFAEVRMGLGENKQFEITAGALYGF